MSSAPAMGRRAPSVRARPPPGCRIKSMAIMPSLYASICLSFISWLMIALKIVPFIIHMRRARCHYQTYTFPTGAVSYLACPWL
jgi:hypothetical protein